MEWSVKGVESVVGVSVRGVESEGWSECGWSGE